MNPVRVSHVSKTYTKYDTELKRVANWFGASFAAKQEFHALTDISFEIQPRQTIGLLGRNGAGKSTLLKIIAGTTYPTAGEVEIRGTVAAILELALGFHPDYNGIENAQNALSLRGFTRREVEAMMPYVEDFAELGKHFKEDLRTYSSGMSSRLAFAVVTAVRPDVLIVDEALSVGDAYFAKKSYARIREFRDLGTSLVIASHGMPVIEELCDRAILLDQGRLLADGTPVSVAKEYADFIRIQNPYTAL